MIMSSYTIARMIWKVATYLKEIADKILNLAASIKL